MSIDPTILRAMQAAGCTTEQIIAVVEADAASEAERREKRREGNRERQRRYRERNADNALHGVTERDARDTPLDKESPQTPKKIIPPGRNILPAREALDLPEGVSGELWDQYRAMRSRIRKPLNPHSEQLALKHLRKFAEDGHPPGDIIEAAIVGSYQGLFPPKGAKNGQRNGHHNGSTIAAADALLADMERADRNRLGEEEARAGH